MFDDHVLRIDFLCADLSELILFEFLCPKTNAMPCRAMPFL